MSLYVFTGPTLSADDGRELLDAHYLPPAAQGDVYTVARQRPLAIGIIDGFFDHVPSVWHKEILWAMSQGVHVFGASSMGALRAAELETFGMVGVGEVFAGYRDGRYEDDDEVAVVHGPPESGFLAGSEAMVNIRATLEAAERAGVLTAALREALTGLAKSRHYAARNWSTLLADAAGAAMPDGLEALEAWLPDGRVDRKRQDAVAMLRAMHELAETAAEPKQVRFTFHPTHVWDKLRTALDGGRAPAHAVNGSPGMNGMLEELQLQGETYRFERERAMVRLLSLEVAGKRGVEVDHAASRIERHDTVVTRLAQDESLVERIRTISRRRLEPHFRDHLEVSGGAQPLLSRAAAKKAALSRIGLDNPSLADVEIDEDELWRWYFRGCLDRDPESDLAAWAETHDFENVDGLRRAVLREYCYRKLDSNP